MKRVFSAAILVALTFSISLFAQKHHAPKPNKERISPHDTVKYGEMMIAYGRPYQKGRMLFGAGNDKGDQKPLVEFGKVWRTGADEATVIKLDRDCKFGNKMVKKGTYSLFTIPGEKEWTVILNSQADQWGAFNYDDKKDVARVIVPANFAKKQEEQFTINADKKGFYLNWGGTSVFVTVKFAPPLPTY